MESGSPVGSVAPNITLFSRSVDTQSCNTSCSLGSELIRRKVQNVWDENFTREEASFDLTHWLSVGSPEQRGADWGFSAIEAGRGPDADFRNNARRVVDDLLDGEAGPHGANGVDNFA